MDDFDSFITTRTPTASRPLLGLTVLLVEDSRFASEAMRLLCLRSGARIRRADCLRSARRHLQVYRPSVVVIDLGLPDGSGADLIIELANATPRVGAILGISGDDNSEQIALAAGADGFLAKPITNLATFQEAILAHIPVDHQPNGPRELNNEDIHPDPIAYRDDMSHVADILGDHHDGRTIDYIAQFITGVARSAHDEALEAAGIALATARSNGRSARSDIARIAGLVQERISEKMAI